jgi:hypothetical protein
MGKVDGLALRVGMGVGNGGQTHATSIGVAESLRHRDQGAAWRMFVRNNGSLIFPADQDV